MYSIYFNDSIPQCQIILAKDCELGRNPEVFCWVSFLYPTYKKLSNLINPPALRPGKLDQLSLNAMQPNSCCYQGRLISGLINLF